MSSETRPWSAARPWRIAMIAFGSAALVGLGLFIVGTALSAAEYSANGADQGAGDEPVSGPLLLVSTLGPALLAIGLAGALIAFIGYIVTARKASGAPKQGS